MRFSRLKSPKLGADLCVLCFTTMLDCWSMFGLATEAVPRSCMTTPSDSWIRLVLRGIAIVRPYTCGRRARLWGYVGRAIFLRLKYLPMRVGSCPDALEKTQRLGRIVVDFWTICLQETQCEE